MRVFCQTGGNKFLFTVTEITAVPVQLEGPRSATVTLN